MAEERYACRGEVTIKVRYYAKAGSVLSPSKTVEKSYEALLEALKGVGLVIDEGFDSYGIPCTDWMISVLSDSRGFEYDGDGDSTDG